MSGTDRPASAANFVETTAGYWQEIEPAPPTPEQPPYRYGYPARLPDGRTLRLPIRERPGAPGRAVASFIPNHGSFEVIDLLQQEITAMARPLEPDVIVALPTLGLALGPGVAKALGHRHYAPLGTSRKFWYRDELSAPVTSITTPDSARRLYLDPNLRSRVEGRRAILVDDTISSGTTILAAAALLERAGAEIVGLAFAMSQSDVWRQALGATRPDLPPKVRYVFQSPLLNLTADGWVPEESQAY